MDTTNGGKYTGFFSKKLRAGKRRTYFFDVRNTKQGDFFVTITESKKKFEGEGYESHKIFLYKEDFKKFVEALNDTVDYIKTELLPEYDYDSERPERPIANPASGSFREEKPMREEKPRKEESPVDSQSKESSTVVNPQIGDDEQMDWN